MRSKRAAVPSVFTRYPIRSMAPHDAATVIILAHTPSIAFADVVNQCLEFDSCRLNYSSVKVSEIVHQTRKTKVYSISFSAFERCRWFNEKNK